MMLYQLVQAGGYLWKAITGLHELDVCQPDFVQ
jgi:hypothetical protein